MSDPCCDHSAGWHGNAGCGFPGCDCTRSVLRRENATVPAGQRITRCSACRRHPYPDGSNHATGCPRAGMPADAPERAPAAR